MDNKKFIRELFKNVFESPEFNEDFIRENVDTDYIQHVDGKTLGYNEFAQHIKLLKTKVRTCSVEEGREQDRDLGSAH